MIACGDSHELLKDVEDSSVDLILTDPPYNIGKYSTGDIMLPGRSSLNNGIGEWDLADFRPEDWCDEFIRVLKPTGNLFIFTTYNQIGRWHACLDHRFDTTQFMIWHKTNPAPKIFKAGFLNSCEMIFCCWNKGHTWNFLSQKEMHNFIESPICMVPERIRDPKHPAQKPVAILKKILKIASNEGDLILDPFMGVGSTGVAAMEMGRRFIGMELDRAYFTAASRRMREIKEEGNTMTAVIAATAGALTVNVSQVGLDRILKWAGGKERELPIIVENMPKEFDRYYEPFVGGGAVCMAVSARESLVNDKSEELISLYRAIQEQNNRVFKLIEEISASWQEMIKFAESDRALYEGYLDFRTGLFDESKMTSTVRRFIDANFERLFDLLPRNIPRDKKMYLGELNRNVQQKILRMRKIEKEKGNMPEADVVDNIVTGFAGALYMYYRNLYNAGNGDGKTPLSTALFVFIRNYAYSGMFRYNGKGEFNVPYGGIGYNHKSLSKKLAYYQSPALSNKFSNVVIECLDFYDFMKKHPPSTRDFIFLGPPYDTEFSTYAKNQFGKEDQVRLAKYLINECKGKWMMIIKNTPYIYSLYDGRGLNIRSFDKKYQVSFMNRNSRDVTHLIITNY